MNFKKVREMSISDLLKDQEFRDHYVSLFNTCHQDTVPVLDENGLPTGKTQVINTLGIDGDAHFVRETGFFKQSILDNEKLAACNALSVMTAFFDIAYHGISIEVIPKPEAYITPKGAKVPGSEEKEMRASLRITGYGELGIRIRNGVIRHIDNPVMVYRGDVYSVHNGIPDHHQRHESEEIIHAYVKITKKDGSVEFKSYSMAEIQGWRAQSDNPNGKPWTGGVPWKDAEGKEHKQPTRGMIETKVIKHSMNALPRIKMGANTELATDADYEELLSERNAMRKEAAYAHTMSNFTNTDEDDDPIGDPPAENNPPVENNPPEDDPLATDSTDEPEEDDPWEPPAEKKAREEAKSKKGAGTKATTKPKEEPPAEESKVEVVQEKPKRKPMNF